MTNVGLRSLFRSPEEDLTVPATLLLSDCCRFQFHLQRAPGTHKDTSISQNEKKKREGGKEPNHNTYLLLIFFPIMATMKH